MRGLQQTPQSRDSDIFVAEYTGSWDCFDVSSLNLQKKMQPEKLHPLLREILLEVKTGVNIDWKIKRGGRQEKRVKRRGTDSRKK